MTYLEAVEAALCFGWIDGQVRMAEEEGWRLQRFTPRRSRSRWSQINVERAEALIAAGRMRPAGLAEVERAKADGRWAAAYPPPSRIEVPDDLRGALDASPAAAEAFAGLSSANRYAILYRVHDAKRAETRARRIEQFVGMLERGETIH
ncbi:MAG TPA: YdeI/OmpD-associated family protein [Solirubrobacteraceae bacterium]